MKHKNKGNKVYNFDQMTMLKKKDEIVDGYSNTKKSYFIGGGRAKSSIEELTSIKSLSLMRATAMAIDRPMPSEKNI